MAGGPDSLLHLTVFVVEETEALGDVCVQSPFLSSGTAHRIKAPGSRTRAIAHSRAPTNAVRDGQAVVARLVVQEADRWRGDRASLCRISLGGQPVVRVIAVCDGRGRAALLVCLRTDLLEQVTVRVIGVVDRAR